MNKIIVTEPGQVAETLAKIDFTCVSFDVETRGLEYDTERVIHGGSYEEGKPTGISFCDGKTAVYIDTCGWSGANLEDLFRMLWTSWQRSFGVGNTIIAHNIVFDLSCLHKYGIDLQEAEWFDTQTASHLLDENRARGYNQGHGLKALARDYLGVEETADWREVAHDKELFHGYALNDSIWTWQLCQLFSKEMREQGLEKLFREVEMPFQRALLEMEVTGVAVDLERLHELSDRAEQHITELEMELLDILGEPYEIIDAEGPTQIDCELNINSGQQLTPRLLGMGIPLSEKTPSGRYSLSESAIKDIKHPFIAKYLEFKNWKHLNSLFINKLPKLVQEDGRIRPNWKNTGTVTGRLSSSQPNFQQLPNVERDPIGIRECVVAPEGKQLVAVDFSSQEIRVMAELSQDPSVIKAITDGYDLHLMNANAAFALGILEEHMNTNHSEYKKVKEEYDEYRRRGKVFSFAVPYGAGASHMAETFELTQDEAERLMDNYWREFPALQQAIESTKEEAHQQGYVENMLGRKKRFTANKWGRIDGREVNAAFNFKIQSMGAELMRLASYAVWKESKLNPQWDAKIVMLVHDELVAEVNEEYAEEFMAKAIDLFSTCYKFETVPIEADGGIGRNYNDAK